MKAEMNSTVTYCAGRRLTPCTKCGADDWKSDGDRYWADWDEEIFVCQQCQTVIHVELPG